MQVNTSQMLSTGIPTPLSQEDKEVLGIVKVINEKNTTRIMQENFRNLELREFSRRFAVLNDLVNKSKESEKKNIRFPDGLKTSLKAITNSLANFNRFIKLNESDLSMGCNSKVSEALENYASYTIPSPLLKASLRAFIQASGILLMKEQGIDVT